MAYFMNPEPNKADKRRAAREVTAFFSLTFALTFALAVAVLFFRPQFEAIFGPLGPLLQSWPYYLAVCTPTLSAILLSLFFGGIAGIKTLFRSLARPFRLRWMFVALLTFPTALLLWGIAERVFSEAGAHHAIDIHAILIAAPVTLLTTANLFIDPGPWGEETGWRGFALPRLLTLFKPLTAAIILGVIWGLWHAPAFLTSDLTQARYSFGWFLLVAVGISIFMTWLYFRANRNFLVAGFIPHAVNNLMGASNAFTDTRIQAFVMLAIVVSIVAVYGWGLGAGLGAQQSPSLRTVQ